MPDTGSNPDFRPDALADRPSLLERARSGGGLLGKLIAIGLLILVLLIPMGMIKGLIVEREMRRGEAEREVTGKWGGSQLAGGPILTVPYRVLTEYRGEKGVVRIDTTVGHAHFLPEELDISGGMHPEVRNRGLFDVPLYRADIELKGRFAPPSFAAWKVDPRHILWEDAFLTFPIEDLRTVADARPVSWDGVDLPLAPENFPGSPASGGLQAKVPIAPVAGAMEEREGFGFQVKLRLNGSGSLKFLPMGKETRLTLASSWNTPSFTGAYLPIDRTIGEDGFRATWKTQHFTRSFPQAWLDRAVSRGDWEPFAFGAELLLPVDRYQKAERCAKYAVLFILLTFLVFFVQETLHRRRIHPVQYLLVGAALCLFYLLLLSLSEHVPFALAYAAASAGVVLMVTCYGFTVLGARKRAWALGAMLAGLYGYLFTLLQMEDFALLMGSLGLFAILGAVMFATRRINWYDGKAGGQMPEPTLQGGAA
jgi:inner membrane protein